MNKRNHLFFHSFRGKRYQVIKTFKHSKNFKGHCDPPDSREKKIKIEIGRSIEVLSTQLHEAIHACQFDLDETTVEEISEDIARLLWRLDWRNVAVSKKESRLK